MLAVFTTVGGRETDAKRIDLRQTCRKCRVSFMPEADTSDALGHIANVLESHARIIESQTALEEKNLALEHHLPASLTTYERRWRACTWR